MSDGRAEQWADVLAATHHAWADAYEGLRPGSPRCAETSGTTSYELFGDCAAAAASAGLGGGAVGAGFADAVGVIAFWPGVHPSWILCSVRGARSSCDISVQSFPALRLRI